MKFHRYAFMFPEMTSEQFNDLKFSIRDNGLRDAIAVWHGQIADGRHRYKACQEVSIDPRYEDVSYMTEAELLDYVIDKNRHRRHLTTGQLAMIALDVKKEKAIEAQDNLRKSGQEYGKGSVNSPNPIKPIDSREEAAKAMGIGSQAVSRAETIAKTSPVLKQAVQSGEVSLNKAYEATKEPEIITELEQSIHDNVWSKGKSVGDMLNELQKKKQKEATQASDYTYQATPKVKDCKNDMVLIEQQIENIMTAIKAGHIEQSHAGWFETRLSHLQTKLDYMIELLGEIANGNS